MWLLNKALGIYTAGYDDACIGIQADKVPLDPIHVAGGANVKALGKTAKGAARKGFTKDAFTFLLDPDYFALTVALPELTSLPRPTTAPKWSNHLSSLEEYRVLQPEPYANLQSVATYFAVLKNADTARSIFNGRRLSEACRPPPPVNLPHLPSLLCEMARISRALNGNISIITGDWRHWFHQIPLAHATSLFFGIATTSKSWRWATLPMGHSWSPWVAQALAWCALTYKEEQEDDLFETSIEDLEQAPQFLRLRGGGLCTVYYDNFIAIGPPRVIDLLKARWERNFRLFNIAVKDCILHFTGKALRSRSVTFLGAEIQLRRKRDRAGSEQLVDMVWRLSEEKIGKWHDTPNIILEPSTPRRIARAIGRLMWRHCLTTTPLCRIASVISILREAARMSRTIGWDAAWNISGEQQKTLLTEWKKLTENEWLQHPCIEDPDHEVVCCSDSSDHKWGYAVYDKTGAVSEWESFAWLTSEEREHIFVKETVAAALTIQKIVQKDRRPGLHVIMGIDNTAAAAAVRRQYSSNEIVMPLLENLADLLRQQKVLLTIIGLRSQDNPADGPSRGTAPEEGHVTRGWEAIVMGVNGQRKERYDHTSAPTPCTGHLRHDEGKFCELDGWAKELEESEE
jgi:hypothetical protein